MYFVVLTVISFIISFFQERLKRCTSTPCINLAVSEVEISESYSPDCTTENAGILMVSQDNNPNKTLSPGPMFPDPADTTSDRISQTSYDNSRNNNVNDLMHRLRLNAESSCQACTVNHSPAEVQKMGYRHPPPYPEQMEQNISNQLNKYRHPPPYREPEHSLDRARFYGQEGTIGNGYSAYYNLEETYRHPPSYNHGTDRFSLDSRMVNSMIKPSAPKKAMSESLILKPNGYNFVRHASNSVSEFYASNGLYSGYAAKPFTIPQDSFSYNASHGDTYISEAGSCGYGLYAEQGASTNNLFSESRSDMFSCGDSPSPPISGGSQSVFSPQAQSVVKTPGSFAMQQASPFGERFFPAGNMSEKKNLGK